MTASLVLDGAGLDGKRRIGEAAIIFVPLAMVVILAQLALAPTISLRSR